MISNPAASRALLVGLSLAELMIIIVFVLLLLVGDEKQSTVELQRFKEALGADSAGQLISIVVDNPEVPNFGAELLEDADKLISDSKRPTKPIKPVSDPVIEQGSELTKEELVDQLARIEKENLELKASNLDLADQIIAKAGERVICTYLKTTDSSDKKRSISLGSVFVEKDGITLKSKEAMLFSEPVFDFVLRPYDVSEALMVLGEWPLGEKLSIEEFKRFGEKFVAIGEKANENRNTCRFALNYELEVIPGTNNVEGRVLNIFDKVVQGYFFPGIKVDSEVTSLEPDVGAEEAPSEPTFDSNTSVLDKEGAGCEVLASTGNPGDADYLRCGNEFAIGFSCENKAASWVAYTVDPDLHDAVNVEHQNNYRLDARVPLECQNDLQAFPKGYDRGHLASSATFDSSVEVNSETFLATNLVPQRKELNRGLWRELEQKVRDLSDQTGSVTVITGPIFPEYGRVVEGGVQIPSEFYKIIYVEAVETSFTFLIPNSRRLSRNLGTYLKSIDEIEALTGLKFLEVNTITQYSDGEWSEFKQLLQ